MKGIIPGNGTTEIEVIVKPVDSDPIFGLYELQIDSYGFDAITI